MKIYLRKSRVNDYWNLWFGNTNRWFQSYDAAVQEANKLWKRFYKESAAHSMCTSISVNLLDTEQTSLVRKLLRTKCKGITKAQYGYLKGIYERQQREW